MRVGVEEVLEGELKKRERREEGKREELHKTPRRESWGFNFTQPKADEFTRKLRGEMTIVRLCQKRSSCCNIDLHERSKQTSYLLLK